MNAPTTPTGRTTASSIIQSRIRDIQDNLPKVQPLYQRAPRPTQRFEPPK